MFLDYLISNDQRMFTNSILKIRLSVLDKNPLCSCLSITIFFTSMKFRLLSVKIC